MAKKRCLLFKNMSSLKIVLILCGVFLLQCTRVPAEEKPVEETVSFVHPGVINEKINLDQIRTSTLLAEQQSTYNQLLTFINDNPINDSYPRIVYIQGEIGGTTTTPSAVQMKVDAILAYAYALKWVRTGEDSDAKSAIQLLNGWSNNFQRFAVVDVGEVQLQLVASWLAPMFAAAAEIIRYYTVDGVKSAGWASDDIDQFSIFLLKLNNYIKPMIKVIEVEGRRHNNWGASAGYAKMSMGVFLEDKAIYDEGKRIIKKLIPEIIKPDGQVYELCERDCSHPQYSMVAFTFAAETARIQGDESIYQANSNRIETGWKWIGKAFANEIECRDCIDRQIFAAIEVAANYYYASTELALFSRKQRPYAQRGTLFLGFTTLTHFNGEDEHLIGRERIMSFTTEGRGGTPPDQLTIWVSTDFDGTYELENVEEASWMEITDSYPLPSTTNTITPWGPLDLTEMMDNDNRQIYVAFKFVYNPNIPSESSAINWRIQNFKIKTTSGVQILNQEQASFKLVHEGPWEDGRYTVSSSVLLLRRNASDLVTPTTTWGITKIIE